MKFSKLTEIVKQIVYIGVIDPAEFKSGRILRPVNFEKFSKTSGSSCWPNTPLHRPKCSLPYDRTETGGKSSHHLCCDGSARIDNAVKSLRKRMSFIIVVRRLEGEGV